VTKQLDSSEASPAPEAGTAATEYASGKVVLDHPAPHVARMRISNPPKRGALDHEILDALTALIPAQEARCA
jgi:hypothetical protein